ncbi:MAG TPA: hypothetical protein VGG33_00595, partial [Polyangia bacterium]
LLLSDGRVCPTPPPALADGARYDEGSDRWLVAPKPGAPDDLHRYYNLEGALEEESRFRDGCRVFVRRHDAGGVTFEANLRPDGRREGAWYRRYADDDSPYLDSRIRSETGAHADDRPVGVWTYRDAGGVEVKTVRFGTPPFLAPDDPVFADELRTDWMDEANRALAEGQVARALCAAARAAARAGDVHEFVTVHAASTVALRPAIAEELARQAAAATDDPLAAIVSALMAGGDAAELLRALSSLTRGTPRAALDFAEAALLLAPDRPGIRFSRALVRIELGEDGGALADARLIEPDAPDVAGFLRAYIQMLFPTWDFLPASEVFGDPVDGVPDAPGQPLAQIQQVMQIYATRLRLIREAITARAPRRARAPWLPPTLESLLPEGPVALRQYEATITDEIEGEDGDEADGGVETVEVVIDETLALDGLGMTGLLLLARRQWAALTWLAWAVGLNRVGLPTEVVPPASFTAGAATALTRYFRVLDTLQTGGLRARTAGAPSFRYAGADIDELPSTIVEIAREETHELRALFLWLLSPENHSPFQSDLRQT